MPTDVAQVARAWPPGLVEAQESVSVPAGEGVELHLIVPEVVSGSYAGDGSAATVAVGDLQVELPTGVGFTDPDGGAWAGPVALRFAALTDYDLDLAPSMLSPDGSGGWVAPDVLRVFELSAVGDAGGAERALQPDAPLTLRLPVLNADLSQDLAIDYFDPALGDWVEQGVTGWEGELAVVDVDHFPWWRVRYNAASFYTRSGLMVFTRENGALVSRNVGVTFTCADTLGSPAGVLSTTFPARGNYICEHFVEDANCTVTVEGGHEATVFVDNGCRCNSSNQQCQTARFDVGTPTRVCGNGVVEAGETCDDGNTTALDGCAADCTTEVPPCDCWAPADISATISAARAAGTTTLSCALNGGVTRFGERVTDQGSSFNIIARDASGGVVSEAQCLIGLFGTDNACAVNDDSGFNVTAPITDLAYGSCLSSLGAVLALEGVTCARNEDGDDYTVVDDCDDTDPAVGPGASEACDGIDNDCDGLIDDADPNLWPGSTTPWCLDRDGDSAGDLATITYACVAPAGAVNDCTDADDADAGVR